MNAILSLKPNSLVPLTGTVAPAVPGCQTTPRSILV